ncbi:MAG: CHAT domain-containing protein [Candidatus Magnetomorum sp.]|nr:CHAT domain-containing protein [Candidatus Magnetomorum sp.]
MSKQLSEKIELEIIQFDSTVEDKTNLRFQLKESGQEHPYKSKQISSTDIYSLNLQFFNLFDQYHHNKSEVEDIQKQIKKIGTKLCNIFFSTTFQKKLLSFQKEGIKFFHLNIDDQLACHFWELLCIDNQFICEMFYMSRASIKNCKDREIKKQREAPSDPVNMLLATGLIKNKNKRLPCVSLEFEALTDLFDENTAISIKPSVKNPASKKYFIKHFCDFDIVHFSGHCAKDSTDENNKGLLFFNEQLTHKDVENISSKKNACMPLLVFFNACQSANFAYLQNSKNAIEKTFGLAHEMILSGCKHFIGTFFEVKDSSAREFALLFYKNLIAHKPIGQAFNEARIEFKTKYPDDPCGNSYVLYGDPEIIYFPDTRIDEDDENTEPIEKKPQATIQNFYTQNRATNFFIITSVFLFAGLILMKGININLTSYAPVIPKDLIIQEKQAEITLKKMEIASKIDEIKRKRLADINQLFKDINKIAIQNKIYDEWSSPPLTLVINFEKPLIHFFRESFEDIKYIHSEKGIIPVIQSQIINKGIFQPILPTEQLHDILLNLKNKLLRYKPGQRYNNLLLAKYFLYLDIEPVNEEYHKIKMEIVDETSEILHVWSIQVSTQKSIEDQKYIICKELMENLNDIYKNHFPLKGRISEVNEDYIGLNIGKMEGVYPKQLFKGVDHDIRFEIFSVGDQSSRVRNQNINQDIKKGWKVISEDHPKEDVKNENKQTNYQCFFTACLPVHH